jgi:hypothetical protein
MCLMEFSVYFLSYILVPYQFSCVNIEQSVWLALLRSVGNFNQSRILHFYFVNNEVFLKNFTEQVGNCNNLNVFPYFVALHLWLYPMCEQFPLAPRKFVLG